MEKSLKLVFLTQEGKDFSLTISSPKDGLTETDVETAMNEIVEQNIIDSVETLLAPKAAYIQTVNTVRL